MRVIDVPEVEPVASAWVDGAAVTFRFPDPGRRLAGVRLRQDVRIPGDLLDFHGADDDWELTVDRPPVTRMEYLFELRYRDGGVETVTDPGNPEQVPGAFGPKSVLEFPSYRPPRWLTADAEPGQGAAFEVPAGSLDGAIAVRTWAPAGVRDDDELPLLVAHDGPEYDALACLTGYLAAGVAGGWLPRLRAALLSPGPRDRWYSAYPRYARALAREVIPAPDRRLATSVRIGMGTSLGALAMLHAHRRFPRTFGPHDRDRPVPVTLTCGAIEENVDNNRLMAQGLRARGYPVTFHEVPDVHNYTAWRDAFDPYLTRLLRLVCG